MIDRLMPWNANASYEAGNSCLHSGHAWLALAPSRGQEPADGLLWRRADRGQGSGEGRRALPGNPLVTEEGP